jgi:hypothetical protein
MGIQLEFSLNEFSIGDEVIDSSNGGNVCNLLKILSPLTIFFRYILNSSFSFAQ